MGSVKVQMIAMSMKTFVLSIGWTAGSLAHQMPAVWNVSKVRGQEMKAVRGQVKIEHK